MVQGGKVGCPAIWNPDLRLQSPRVKIWHEHVCVLDEVLPWRDFQRSDTIVRYISQSLITLEVLMLS